MEFLLLQNVSTQIQRKFLLKRVKIMRRNWDWISLKFQHVIRQTLRNLSNLWLKEWYNFQQLHFHDLYKMFYCIDSKVFIHLSFWLKNISCKLIINTFPNPIASFYNKKYKKISMLRIKVEKIKIEKFILEFMLF